MESSGLDETIQLVRVVEGGREKFFEISGDVLRTTGSITKNVSKIIALMIKNAKQKIDNANEKHLINLMNDAAAKRDMVYAVEIKDPKMNEFADFAKLNGMNYSVLKNFQENSGKTIVAYTGLSEGYMTEFVEQHREDVTYTSVMTISDGTSLRQINMSDKSYISVANEDIVAVDRKSQYVRVKLGTVDAPMYADIPANTVLRGRNEGEILIGLRNTDVCMCYTRSEQQRLSGSQLAKKMLIYEEKETAELKNCIYNLKCSINEKNELLRNPIAKKSKIKDMYRKEQYGTSGRVVSFFNGANKKTITVGKVKKNGEAVRKAVSQMKR